MLPHVDALPTCSGVQIKTRKRNIAVALDPGSFANAVVVCFEDARDTEDLEKNLQSAVKARFASTLAVLDHITIMI